MLMVQNTQVSSQTQWRGRLSRTILLRKLIHLMWVFL